MAFPDTRLRHRLQAAFGADADASPTAWSWTSITGDINAQQISVTRGQANEGGEAAPTSISVVLDNPSGDYTPGHPLGQHYPDIDQGVPMRYAVDGGTTHLALDGTGYATTPDTAALDVTGDIDVRFDATLANWFPVGTLTELMGKFTTTGNQRSWGLYVQDGKVHFTWSPDGTQPSGFDFASTAQFSVPPSGRLAVRATLDADNGAGGLTVRFYTAATIAGPWTQLGDTQTNAATTSIYNSTAPLTIGNVVLPETAAAYENAIGQIHAAEVRNGIGGSQVANPVFADVAEATTSFADTAGRTWTLTGDAAIDPWQPLFAGNADSWEPVWPYGDLSNTDTGYDGESQVTVTASGILRRLGQGEEALQSTLRRRIPSYSPVAYWPWEEGADATTISSPVDGVAAFTPSGFELASDTSLVSSAPLPTVRTGASFTAIVPPAAAGTWQMEFVYYLETMPGSLSTMIDLRTTGTARQILVRVQTNNVRMECYDVDGNQIALGNVTAPGFTGGWNRLQIKASTSGSNVTYNLTWIEIGEIAHFTTDTIAASAGYVTSVRNTYDSGLDGLRLGHLAVFSTQSYSPYNSADIAFAGERAADRMLRLCREEGVPFLLNGRASDTERMGPQRVAALTDLLGECATVDGGPLGEQRAVQGLAYRTRASLYNQTPAIVLSASGDEIANPFAPVLDDQRLRNAITVSRDGGSSATVTDEASILRRRRYADAPTVNAYTDERLPQLAGWRLHLGTWPGMRYPSVSLDLAAAPHLIPTWLTMDFGSRFQVIDLPPQHPTDLVDLLLQGYTQTISPNRWNITANCTPGGPYTVAGRAYYEDFEDTTFVLPYASGGNAAWTRSTAHFNSGTTSLRSGAIGNNQTSDAIFTLPSGARELRFWYWTSSENSGVGFEGDRLLVLVDGVQVLRAQGTTGWTQKIVELPDGATTLTFRYAKDNSATAGEDAVHIDDISVTGLAPSRRDTAGSQLAADVTATATSLSVATTLGPVWTQDPVHMPFQARLGGEVVSVTSVTGTTSPQTWTVVRSVNGIVKPQTAGTPVSLTEPAIRAL